MLDTALKFFTPVLRITSPDHLAINEASLRKIMASHTCLYIKFCRIAFARFSNHQDAVAALKEVDGFNLKGCTLIVSPEIKQQAQAQQKLKGSAAKKQENERTFKKESELSTSGKNDNGPLPLMRLNVANPENWEQDGGCDKVARDKIIGKEDLESCVVKVNDGYPIHVSNFPAGTNQVKGAKKINDML